MVKPGQALPGPAAPDRGIRTRFEETGFAGPFRIFDRRECQRIMWGLGAASSPLDWWKGCAASSRFFYELGTHSEVLKLVTDLLGEDVMLWGASIVQRRPGQVHAWHTDLETAGETGRTVTVWIGLANTDRRSSLMLIPYSHRFRASLQEVAFEDGKKRGDSTTEDVVLWARQRDNRSDVVQLAMGDGDALMFDGRLWHGSSNTRESGERTALLLQYATPDTPMRIPDLKANFEWPFQFLDHPRPPCIMVHGTDRHEVNRMVTPPPDADPIWPNWIRQLDSKLEEDERTGWKTYPLFRGSTPSMESLSSHASVLSAGTEPHPPHEHPEEELIVMLSGEADIVKLDELPSRETTIERIRPGYFLYHAAHQRHTIQSVGPDPATYVIFKWSGPVGNGEGQQQQSAIFHFEENLAGSPSISAEGMEKWRILNSPTRYLRKLHCHVTTLQPGAGYPAHRDAYDVAIVVLSGTVETLGREVGPRGVIFYAAGEPHGMRNVGDTPATYLVFEFHGGGD